MSWPMLIKLSALLQQQSKEQVHPYTYDLHDQDVNMLIFGLRYGLQNLRVLLCAVHVTAAFLKYSAHAGNSGAFQEDDSEPLGSAYMTLSQLKEAIKRLGAVISKHQIISIYRRMPKDVLQRVSVRSILQALC